MYDRFSHNTSYYPWEPTHANYVQYSPAESNILEAAVTAMVKDKMTNLVVPFKTKSDVPGRFFACLLRNSMHINIVKARMMITLGTGNAGLLPNIRGMHNFHLFSRPIMTPDRVKQMYQNFRFTTLQVTSTDLMRQLWEPYFKRCEALVDELCFSEQSLDASALTLAYTTLARVSTTFVNDYFPVHLQPARVDTIRTVIARTLNTLRDAPPVLPSVIRRMLNMAPSSEASAVVRPADLALIIPVCMERLVCVAFVGVGDRAFKAVYLDLDNPLVVERRLIASEEINAITQGWELRTDEQLTDAEMNLCINSMHKFHRATLNRILYIPCLLPIALAVSRKRWEKTSAPIISRLNDECMARIVRLVLEETQ